MAFRTRCYSCLIKHSENYIVRRISSNTVRHSHRVLLSVNQNIYYNLALEDWIYDNYKVTDDSGLLLLWRNNPCVVIGRHQNPWLECDVESALSRHMTIARRKSGGGTVYHDLGNINLTFVTTKQKYNRQKNLSLIVKALTENWNLDVTISDRGDILLNNKYKISGTASKLGRLVAYHHCTLLYDVNKDDLETVLHTRTRGLQSRATESVRSEIKNLKEVESSISYKGLVDLLANLYLESYNTKGHIEEIDPRDEQTFPGLQVLHDDLCSWDWVFGKTPRFSVHKLFHKMDEGQSYRLEVKLVINKGLICEAKLTGSIEERLLRSVQECVLESRIWPRGRPETKKILQLGNGKQDEEVLSWVAQCFCNLL